MTDNACIVGTLNDKQIRDECSNSNLISREFSVEQIKQACYELRSGKVFHDLTADTGRQEITDGKSILIKPRHTVVLISLEELLIPNDIIGRVLTKGAFFSLGLSPVNTYADPGFSGNLGIVLFNNSNNYIKIPSGTGIAKIEFSRLSSPVENHYSGQHGYQTGIWPIRKDLILTQQQIKDEPGIDSPLNELISQHGDDFSKLVKRVFKYERRLLLFGFLVLIVNLGIIWRLQNTELLSTAILVMMGIISNLIAIGVTLLATNLRR